MAYGISFMKRLLETFLTGLAVTTGVHFLVYPVTCRKIVFKEFAGYLGALQGGLKAHRAYLHSLEDPENFAKAFVSDVDSTTKPTAETAGVRAAIGGITALHGKDGLEFSFVPRLANGNQASYRLICLSPNEKSLLESSDQTT